MKEVQYSLGLKKIPKEFLMSEIIRFTELSKRLDNPTKMIYEGAGSVTGVSTSSNNDADAASRPYISEIYISRRHGIKTIEDVDIVYQNRENDLFIQTN